MKQRNERLAVSLTDLDRVPMELRGPMLAGKLDLTQAVRVGTDRVEDVPAVAFTCDLLTAATVCDLLRSNDRKRGDPPTGLYICKDRSWTRITNSAVLTVLASGRVALNPAVFPEEAGPGTAPQPKIVRKGG